MYNLIYNIKLQNYLYVKTITSISTQENYNYRVNI